jgi:hypothetical protein
MLSATMSVVRSCCDRSGHAASCKHGLPTNLVGTEACVGAHHLSRSFDNCTTSTSANHQCRTNVASSFDRFGGRYMVGAFRFHYFKIGPLPTPATSGFIWPVLDASRCASVSARVPAATACCRNTTRVERFSEGGYPPICSGTSGIGSRTTGTRSFRTSAISVGVSLLRIQLR